MDIEKKNPIGITDFEELITGGYTYVDKTDMIYHVVKTGMCYFYTHPRGFGKSLLLSTMRYYFEGRRDLFKGLAIEKLEKEWKSYPVFYVDLAMEEVHDLASFKAMMDKMFQPWEEKYGPYEYEYDSVAFRFTCLLQKMKKATGKSVAILIDNYDTAVMNNIFDKEVSSSIERVVHEFLLPLKSEQQYIEFHMVTGETDFRAVEIFESLNHFYVLKNHYACVDMCGFTKAELTRYFSPQLKRLAQSENVSEDEIVNKMMTMYGGFCFGEFNNVCNPVSVLNTLLNMRFDSYWMKMFEPEMLLHILKGINFRIGKYDGNITSNWRRHIRHRSDPFNLIEEMSFIVPYMVTEYDYSKIYTLKCPNLEVRHFFDKLIDDYFFAPTDAQPIGKPFDPTVCQEAMQNNDLDALMQHLKTYISTIDGKILAQRMEKPNLHFLFSIFFQKVYPNATIRCYTENLFADFVVITPKYFYDFKFLPTPEENDTFPGSMTTLYSISQEPEGRQIVKISVTYSLKQTAIYDWTIQNKDSVKDLK